MSAYITTECFVRFAFITEDVEQFVGNLECDACVQTELSQAVYVGLAQQ
jgi:hypothetical protein